MSEYKEPKAKKIYVAYSVNDADELLAFRTPELAVADTDPEAEDVYAVYEFLGLVKLTEKTRVVVTRVGDWNG